MRDNIGIKYIYMTKHLDNLCIRNHVTIFVAYVFNVICVFKNVIKIHHKNCTFFKIGMLAGMAILQITFWPNIKLKKKIMPYSFIHYLN